MPSRGPHIFRNQSHLWWLSVHRYSSATNRKGLFVTDDNPYASNVSKTSERPVQMNSADAARKQFRWQVFPALLSAILGLFYCLLVFISVERLPDLFENWNDYSAPWAELLTSSILGLVSAISAMAMFFASRCWLRNRLRIACVLFALGVCGYLAVRRYGKWDWIYYPMTDVTTFLGLDPYRE